MLQGRAIITGRQQWTSLPVIHLPPLPHDLIFVQVILTSNNIVYSNKVSSRHDHMFYNFHGSDNPAQRWYGKFKGRQSVPGYTAYSLRPRSKDAGMLRLL